MFWIHAAALLALVASTPGAPHGAPTPAERRTAFLTGSWNVEYESRVNRTGDGTVTVLARDTGTLTLEQRESTLKGSWRGAGKITWAVTGTFDRGRLQLTSEWKKMPATLNGQKVEQKSRWVFNGTLQDDELRGVMFMDTGRESTLGPLNRKWIAKRASSGK